MINYGKQNISPEDIAAVLEVLSSDYLTQGPKAAEFEQAVQSHCKASFAVATNSATSALHCACLALGLEKGDLLWTSPITFVASANCARYCGAEVDFVDIDPETYNLSPAALADKLTQAKQQGRLPKVIVAVHLCGQPCNMQAIRKLTEPFGIKLIEDASHALGATYQNTPVGDCRYSDITVFSFHPVKIITSAEGGMAVTNDPDLARKMRLLSSHSITRDPQQMLTEHEEPWYYEQIGLGYNYRMSDLHAALGLSQMNRLKSFIERRQEIAVRYDHALEGLELSTPLISNNCQSSFHLYVIRLPASLRLPMFNHLKHNGIMTNVHYIPVHLQPYYRNLGFNPGDFPAAETYYQEALTLPVYPDLSDTQQDTIIQHIEQFMYERPKSDLS